MGCVCWREVFLTIKKNMVRVVSFICLLFWDGGLCDFLLDKQQEEKAWWFPSVLKIIIILLYLRRKDKNLENILN